MPRKKKEAVDALAVEDSPQRDESSRPATGKFYAHPVSDGFRVVGRNGSWVSGVVTQAEANDLVTRFNALAH